jgi:hypothetical protein
VEEHETVIYREEVFAVLGVLGAERGWTELRTKKARANTDRPG